MLSKIFIVLIPIGAIILTWLLMSAIYYLVVFTKAFIQSFKRIDSKRQAQITPNLITQLENKNSDSQLEIDYILRMINEDEIVEILNNRKKINSKDLRIMYILKESVGCAQHINSRKVYIEMFKNMDVPANRTKPDIPSPHIKLPILYSNSRESMTCSAQN